MVFCVNQVAFEVVALVVANDDFGHFFRICIGDTQYEFIRGCGGAFGGSISTWCPAMVQVVLGSAEGGGFMLLHAGVTGSSSEVSKLRVSPAGSWVKSYTMMWQ